MAVGVIGLGNIGGAIAANLVADGHEVVVYDLDPARMDAVAGASGATGVEEVARAAEITLLSLPHTRGGHCRGHAVGQCRRAPLGGRRPVHRQPGRGAPVGEPMAETGHHFVEAPLTGGAIGAERRLLVFMMGGDEQPVERVRPLLEPLGRAVFHVGELGTAN